MCRICGGAAGRRHVFVERMLGLGGEFEYFECSECRCLQIARIPEALERFYSGDYYSLHRSSSRTRLFLNRARTRYAVQGRGLLGRVLIWAYPDPAIGSLLKINLTPKTRILDVGCGSGDLLDGLKEIGYENVLGIDPYVEGDRTTRSGLQILKSDIHSIAGVWDLIMFHHSFEHVADPKSELVSVERLLSPEGSCIIRTPTVTSFAWGHYKDMWVQIDAPRHSFIQSVKSMEVLARNAGMVLDEVVYDSTEFQFWGSELYLRGETLKQAGKVRRRTFSRSQNREWRQMAERLNSQDLGDQAAFYLRRRGH